MNTITLASYAVAALELFEDGLRKIIYCSDRLQEKLELHKLAVIGNEQRKAEDNLLKLGEAYKALERKRTLDVYAVNAKATEARGLLHKQEVALAEKEYTTDAVFYEVHDAYIEKALSRGWSV